MLAASRSAIPFLGIGLVAGLFSALFGVGGGIIVVPLLIVLARFEPRVATGTSLAAIGITAAFGVVVYGVLGRIHWVDAVLVGVPAIGGVLLGSWLQGKVSSRVLTLAFAAFLVVVAIQLLLR